MPGLGRPTGRVSQRWLIPDDIYFEVITLLELGDRGCETTAMKLYLYNSINCYYSTQGAKETTDRWTQLRNSTR